MYKLCVQVPEEVRKELCFVAKVDLELPDHLPPEHCNYKIYYHSCFYEALGNKTRVSCMYSKYSSN